MTTLNLEPTLVKQLETFAKETDSTLPLAVHEILNLHMVFRSTVSPEDAKTINEILYKSIQKYRGLLVSNLKEKYENTDEKSIRKALYISYTLSKMNNEDQQTVVDLLKKYGI